jgi:anthranilate/para-aminobenzoate synthase component I
VHQTQASARAVTCRDTSPSVAQVLRAAATRPGTAVLELETPGMLVCWGAAPAELDPGDWRRALRGLLRPGGAPWSGGVVGWIGYEAGAQLDRQPVHDDRAVPTVALWRWEAGLIRTPSGRWRPVGSAVGRADATALLARARGGTPVPLAAPVATAPPPPEGQATRYRQAVRGALAHIAAGDVYQVCLAWEQELRGAVDPVAAWLSLREANPAARAALLRVGDTWVLSNSPETFIDVTPGPGGLQVRSAPIKGTVAVSAGPAGRTWLERSPKERAELTMIVDLVRNDLGRVAAPGTVVAGPRTLRRCGDLLHAEQVVRAHLAPGHDAVDALAAAFPPGSVTGAPKIRAMSLIHRLEGAGRGAYTGTLGVWGDDGSARTSVVIRTAIVEPDRTRYHVGAGIVADSDPEREWQETRAKGEALGAALVRAVSS